MIFGFLSLLVAFLLGAAVIAATVPRELIVKGSRLFFVVIACGAGMAMGSAIYFLRLRISGWHEYHPLIMDGLAILCLLVAAISKLRPESASQNVEPDSPAPASESRLIPLLMFGALGVIAFFAAHAAWTIVVQRPHGQWDAWAIWDLHARFLFRGGADWQLGFTEPLAWSHLDYPLLLPAAVARGWEYADGENFSSSAVIALLFTALIPALLFGALSWMRRNWVGALAALLILSSAYYMRMGVSMCADVPLAFFILGAIICAALAVTAPDKQRPMFVLAGFMAGCAAWTKNEGLLFCVVFPVVIAIAALMTRRIRQAGRMIAAYVWGLAPLLLVVIIFKVSVGGRSDLFADLSGQTLIARLTDPQRHQLILSNAFSTMIGRFSGLTATPGGTRIEPLPSELFSGHYNGIALMFVVVAALWSRFRHARTIKQGDDVLRWQAWFILTCMLLMIAGYYFIYLVTPYNLEWHVTTSMHRLVFHVWPCGILLIMLLFPGRNPTGGLPMTQGNS